MKSPFSSNFSGHECVACAINRCGLTAEPGPGFENVCGTAGPVFIRTPGPRDKLVENSDDDNGQHCAGSPNSSIRTLSGIISLLSLIFAAVTKMEQLRAQSCTLFTIAFGKCQNCEIGLCLHGLIDFLLLIQYLPVGDNRQRSLGKYAGQVLLLKLIFKSDHPVINYLPPSTV